jgi:phage terminase large subunit-like protein
MICPMENLQILSPPFSPSSLEVLLSRLQAETERRQSRTRLLRYRPYPKQAAFHTAGAVRRERLLMAGNQLGKTYCGAAEAAFHLTGRYPDWWSGRRWDRPVRVWAGSETSEVTRDCLQRLLIGEPKNEYQWGTRLILGDDLEDWSRRHGVPDALDSAIIKHSSGGHSTLGFKSYDQGRTKWQGETLDFVWFDEEPPIDLYIEGLTRTNATGGMVYLTFTPLQGMSDVVYGFISECGQL